MIPIKRHEIKIYEPEGYDVEVKTTPKTEIEIRTDFDYSFLYCVAYRDPSEPEWILARGFWNDDGIWTDDDIWRDF